MNDPLETLQAELARQNETLSAFEQTLRGLGDVEVAIPPTFFSELEECCGAATAPTTSFGVPIGIRA